MKDECPRHGANVDIDVGEVVACVVQDFAARARERHLDLSFAVDLPPFSAFRGAPELIREVLVSVVANAFSSFTEAAGITISVEVAEATSEVVDLLFDVRDAAVGVTPGAQGSLFEPGATAAAAEARGAGSSRGLAEAHKLARAMGGEIQMRGVAGRGGICLRVRVEPGGTDSADDRRLPGKRVLVVAAERSMRTCLTAELTAWALRVHQASTVDDAYTFIAAGRRRRESYDLIIADAGSVGGSTVNFINEVHDTDPAPAVAFIAGSGRPGDGAAARNAGAVFYLPVPARPLRLFECVHALWENESAAAPAPGAAPGQVLVVEDDLLNQRVTITMVERAGYHPVVVASGAEALAALENGQFAAVLMDCQLPDMDGFEITAQIREGERGTPRRVPVIAVTANASEAAYERCLAAGMDDYLTKPVHAGALVEVLARWTGVSAPNAAAPHVDTTCWQQLTQGDTAEVARYARLFHDEIVSGLGEIRGSAAQPNPRHVLAVVHRLKGAAACVGAVDVLDVLTRFEAEARADQGANLRQGAARIEEAYRRYSAALKIPA